VATITAEDAIALGASGPTLRASGVDIDLRRDMPYSGYENFQFNVPVATEGDVFRALHVSRTGNARINRYREQAADGMPEGPIKANAPKVVLPDREKMKTEMEALIYHFQDHHRRLCRAGRRSLSSSRVTSREMGYYVVSDGTAKPYRVHMRAHA